MSLVTKLFKVVAEKNQEVDFNFKVSLKGQFATLVATSSEGVVLSAKSGKVACMLDMVENMTNEIKASIKTNIDIMLEALEQGKTISVDGIYTLLRVNEKTVTLVHDETGKKKYMDKDKVNSLSRDSYDILYREVA